MRKRSTPHQVDKAAEIRQHSEPSKVLWQHKLPAMDLGAATVANDVVFTSTYAGLIYAFDTETGKTLWKTRAPAGINSFPAIDGDTLLVGAGTSGVEKKPQFQLVAYSLP